jgi:hypothetical protein
LGLSSNARAVHAREHGGHGQSDMIGQTRLVERKIRVWIVRQESNRRKAGELGRIGERHDVPIVQRRRSATLPGREH